MAVSAAESCAITEIAILSNGGGTMANCFICQTELAPPMRAPHTVYVRKLFLVGGQTYCPASSTS